MRLRRPDGTQVWAGLEAGLETSAGGPDEAAAAGDTAPWRLILSDIGERKLADDERREEERYRDRFIATLGRWTVPRSRYAPSWTSTVSGWT